MAAVLTRAASQPFFPSSTGGACARSSPSVSISHSPGPAIYSAYGDRNVSYESKASDSSAHLGSYLMRDENDPFVERQGRGSVTPQAGDQRSASRISPLIASRTSSWSTVIRASCDRQSPQAVHVETCDALCAADCGAECGTPYEPRHERRATSSLTHLPLPFHDASVEAFNGGTSSQYCSGNDAAGKAAPVLERQQSRSWIGFLRRGHSSHKRKASAASQCTEPSDVQSTVQTATATLPGHQRSSSQTSAYVLSAIYENRSGAAAESSGNAARRSVRSSLRRSWARSNESSNARPRVSDDGFHSHGVPGLDDEAWKRAMQRRRIIEELISSEESYIAEMRIFVNVYFQLLVSVPALSPYTRESINNNVLEILALHEELLGELHRVVPHSELSQAHSTWRWPEPNSRHPRLASAGSVPDYEPHRLVFRKRRESSDTSYHDRRIQAGVVADAKVAGKVAQVFTTLMKRFLAYEEYGAKYEVMVRDVASTFKTIPTWDAYERGIEKLANILMAVNKDESPRKRALTLEDLIIKPIQRVCKYPLFFASLYKATPVYDCPESHAELEKVLYRLREVTSEINKATHDPQTRDRIEKTWLLQDRLLFTNELESNHMATLRQFGRVILCGVLHVAWQGVSRDAFNVVACIGLDGMKLEAPDNCKGLQCHTAFFTWKILFEMDCRLFEIMLSACSAREEEVWKTALHERADAEALETDGRQTRPLNMYASMSLEIKAYGSVLGQPGTLARRISIQRAMTVGAKSSLAQVVIQNTHALRDGPEPRELPPQPINRSQSLLSSARIPVLAPRRRERVRLEIALMDLWTRDVLPYPGMGGKRGEYKIKASASSMMRKLSIASLASTFSKRSASYASVTAASAHDHHYARSPPSNLVHEASAATAAAAAVAAAALAAPTAHALETPKPAARSTRPAHTYHGRQASTISLSGAAARPDDEACSGAATAPARGVLALYTPPGLANTPSPGSVESPCVQHGLRSTKAAKEKTFWRRRAKIARTLSVDGIRKLFR